jgi:hypothetical protein
MTHVIARAAGVLLGTFRIIELLIILVVLFILTSPAAKSPA